MGTRLIIILLKRVTIISADLIPLRLKMYYGGRMPDVLDYKRVDRKIGPRQEHRVSAHSRRVVQL